MGFADEVTASTTSAATSVGHVVRALNALSPRERKEIVAYLDDLPAGVQKVAVGRALSKRAAAAGHDIKITGSQVSSFIAGNRNGLQA
jgi:hypothetical protein